MSDVARKGLARLFAFQTHLHFDIWQKAEKLIVKCCWLRFLCAVAWQQRAEANE